MEATQVVGCFFLSEILEKLEGQAQAKAVHSLGQPCSSAFCLFNTSLGS